jgi:predicted transcriptional regulator
MGSTKLERNLIILKILALNGSLKNSRVAYELKLDVNASRKNLNFLVTHGLVECKVNNRKNFYSITQRGNIVLKYFNELKPELSTVEEINNS